MAFTTRKYHRTNKQSVMFNIFTYLLFLSLPWTLTQLLICISYLVPFILLVRLHLFIRLCIPNDFTYRNIYFLFIVRFLRFFLFFVQTYTLPFSRKIVCQRFFFCNKFFNFFQPYMLEHASVILKSIALLKDDF